MFNRTAFALLVSALCSVALWAQQPAPQAPRTEPPPVTFRVEVDYVEVDALVADAQGNLVSDLRAEEFEVLEDGRPQKVTAFSLVNIPIERAVRPLFANRPVEVDVQTNNNVEGRIYLLVLDDLHTDFTRSPRVKAAARRFIEQNFGTNDLAAVVFTGRGEDAQDFTNDQRLLLRAIDKFLGRKLQGATINRLQGARVNPDTGNVGPGDDIDEQERAFRARNAMSTIRRLAEFMSGVRGRRKALLLVGEGVDYNIYEAVGILGSTASSVMLDTHDAIAAATRGNVSIYALDPRGLVTGGEDLITQSSTFPDQGAGLNSMQSELRLSQDSLRVLAANTGGFAAVNRNDLDGAFDRIVQENSSYYVLGFYSNNDRRAGRYRKLEVRVKRPGLRVVRARNGYYEARGRRPNTPAPSTSPNAMPPLLAETIGSPLPVSGIPMKVFAGAYKGVAPNAAVALAVEIDANALTFVEKGGVFLEQLDVVHTATDSRGKVFPGERTTMNLALKPDTFERVKEHGFRVLAQLNLAPGRYQMRVAASSRSGKAGSVLYDIDVPDFYKAPFAMSGVSLTSGSALQGPTMKAKDALGDFLPGPPTAAREFRSDDTLVLFAEFYENAGKTPAHALDLVAELRDEGGAVVRESREERSSTEVGGSGGYGFLARLPLEGLKPGLYVLHVGGQSRLGDRPSASRDIAITVK
jgi:VWFA-related protein